MSSNTEFNHYKALKTIVLDNFSSIRIYKCTHEKALDMLNTRVYDTNHYKRLNGYSKAYFRGMIEMLFREIEIHYTVYLYQWIDGKLYSSEELKKIEGFTWERYMREEKNQFIFTGYLPQQGLYSGKYWIEKSIHTNEYLPYYTSLNQGRI